MAPAPRIAIIDDELSVRTALGRLLAAASFDVTTYGAAREFIDSLRIEVPDSVIADVHMPDFSGLDLLHYLRRARRSIPVIIVTAFDEVDLRAQCLASGAVTYFTKPLDGAELVSAVRAAVARSVQET